MTLPASPGGAGLRQCSIAWRPGGSAAAGRTQGWSPGVRAGSWRPREVAQSTSPAPSGQTDAKGAKSPRRSLGRRHSSSTAGRTRGWSPVSLSSAVQPQESHRPSLGLSIQACKMGWLCKSRSAQQSPLAGQWRSTCVDHRCPTYRPICCLQALGRPVVKGWGAGATLATFRGLWSPFPRLGFEGGQGGCREVLWGQERGWQAELGGWCGSLESLGLSASPALFTTCTVLVKISLIRKDGLLSP